MLITQEIKDYKIYDTGDGMKLESWAGVMLARPDPQVVWKKQFPEKWKKADAIYHRSSEGGGKWNFYKKLPERWEVEIEGLRFYVRPTGFKHTGLFPEQACNWKFIKEHTEPGDQVLNLFAYTGGATAAAAKAGAAVCHVDASKGMVQAAKENLRLSGLGEAPVRYIVDDCRKFVEREIRRGNRYDGVIMDPPSYGRGPNGEVWKLEECAYDLLALVVQILTDKPLFFLINSYTTGLSPASMGYMLMDLLPKSIANKGILTTGELGLPVTQTGLYLPAGASARWERKG